MVSCSNTTLAGAFLATVLFFLSVVTCTAAELGQSTQDQQKDTLLVLDVKVVSTNQLMVGTNIFSIAAATNYVAAQRHNYDIIALHGGAGGAKSGSGNAAIMERIARLGAPLLLVEQDGEYAWRERSDSSGVRSVSLGTEQFGTLRRFLTRQKKTAGEDEEPVLKTTLRMDTEEGVYELDRIELGLFGRNVWFMHQRAETGADDDDGTVGILFKMEW